MSIECNGMPLHYTANPLGNSSTRLITNEEMLASGNTNSKTESLLTEAIRLYRNFVLTGVRELTSEEKEEIKGLIEDYFKKHGFLALYRNNQASKKDYADLNSFIQGLFSKFGRKGDYYEFVTGFVDGQLKKAVDPSCPPHPPFKVEIPPEHALANAKKKPMLTPFQALSPHQFLMDGDSSADAPDTLKFHFT